MSLVTKIIANSTELVVRDILDIGLDYAQTLAHWHANFKNHRTNIEKLGYDERFQNLWSYYLGYCEGGFLERRISAAQILASKAPHTY